MCLIIASQKASTILETVTREEILTAATRNKDGVGVMYISKEGQLVKDKFTPANLDKEAPQKLTAFILMHLEDAHPERAFAAHLRFTTHGGNLDINTHPHEVLNIAPVKRGAVTYPGKNIQLMHNGVIHKTSTYQNTNPLDNASYSDTARFVHCILNPLLTKSPDLFEEKAFQMLISEYIGLGSKLCILDNQGKLTFINENQGTWRKDVWFSTISYIHSYDSYKGTSYYGNNYNNFTRKDGAPKKDMGGSGGGSGGEADYRRNNSANYKGLASISTKHIPLFNIQEEVAHTNQRVQDCITKEVIEKLNKGSLTLKAEPNLKSKIFSTSVSERISLINGNTFSHENLCKFFLTCPQDAAEMLYYIIKKYDLFAKDLESIWEENDPNLECAEIVMFIKENMTYQDLCAELETKTKGYAFVYHFITSKFEYPCVQEFVKKRKGISCGGTDALTGIYDGDSCGYYQRTLDV